MDVRYETNVGTRPRNANMIQKVEGPRKTAIPRTMGGRLLRPVTGVNNATTWRGDAIVGTIPANGASELNQNQILHQKCGRQRHSDGPA